MVESSTPSLSPEAREQVYRRNFVYFLADNILFTVAISILGTTTVIPDFVRRLTDSEILIGLSGNIFNIGYTLPQLFVARYILRFANKKWWFVGPNIPVRFIMLLFAGLIVWFGQGQAATILAVFFICYAITAIGDGLVGVPWADLVGTSLDNRWRARMFGLAAAISGIIMLLLAPLIGRILGHPDLPFPLNYAVLFGFSGIIFVISILPGLPIQELPGGKAVDKLPSLKEFLPELGGVLRNDGPFRAFIFARIFTSLLLMSAPFYIGYATVQLGLSSEVAVPILLAMQTIGSVVGSLLYMWLGARNNLLYIQIALVSGALLPICALFAEAAGPWVLYLGFLISGLAAGSNLFICFLNWMVGYAGADERPIYVGLSNTIMAIVSFLVPLIAGTIVENFGYRPLFAVSMVMAFNALFVTLRYFPKGEAANRPRG